MKSDMTCPHCDANPAMFEATESIPVTPVVENWKFDAPEWTAKARKAIYTCIDCGKRVTIDFPTKAIWKAK